MKLGGNRHQERNIMWSYALSAFKWIFL